MRFKVVLEPSEEGGYTVYVPSLPGCISEGETMVVWKRWMHPGHC
jgi:predicted RNase H-like HicB family nuclease